MHIIHHEFIFLLHKFRTSPSALMSRLVVLSARTWRDRKENCGIAGKAGLPQVTMVKLNPPSLYSDHLDAIKLANNEATGRFVFYYVPADLS